MKLKISLCPYYRVVNERGNNIVVVNATAKDFSPRPATKIIEVAKLKDIPAALEQAAAEYGHPCQSYVRCEGRTPAGFYNAIKTCDQRFYNIDRLETIEEEPDSWYATTVYSSTY